MNGFSNISLRINSRNISLFGARSYSRYTNIFKYSEPWLLQKFRQSIFFIFQHNWRCLVVFPIACAKRVHFLALNWQNRRYKSAALNKKRQHLFTHSVIFPIKDRKIRNTREDIIGSRIHNMTDKCTSKTDSCHTKRVCSSLMNFCAAAATKKRLVHCLYFLTLLSRIRLISPKYEYQ